MMKKDVHIVDCPINSFKLSGRDIESYYDQALHEAQNLYLKLYDEVYRNLMFKNFNALWTPDRYATNDIDPKDGFWSMYVFFFNTSLIKILSEKYNVTVFDYTSYKFRNQKHFYKFLKNKGIKIVISEKKRNSTSLKHSLKLLAIHSIQNARETIKNAKNFFKEEFIKKNPISDISFDEESDKKTIYLAIPPVSKRRIDFFLKWRYKKILEVLKTFKNRGFTILLVAIKDYDKLDRSFSQKNVFRLVTKKEKIKIFLKSIFYRLKILVFVCLKWLNESDPLKRYFLKNIPTNLYYALKVNLAYDKLFKSYGPGLWIMKGPLVYKGVSMRNYNAGKNHVRSLSISGRIMTQTRITNSFIKSHMDEQFPNVLPHSVYVTDSISYSTIRQQTDKIHIYSGKMTNGAQEDLDIEHDFFSITIILQKRNEIESMVDTVLSALQNFDNVVLNLKPHPDFPIYPRLKKKYSKKKNVKIFSHDTSLIEAVKRSDVCISCYSSAVFEFVKNKRPIIWLNNVTLNSLLFKDVHEKMGESVNNIEELEELIRKIKNDPDYYQKLKEKHNNDYYKFINELDKEMYDSLTTVIEKELEKV